MKVLKEVKDVLDAIRQTPTGRQALEEVALRRVGDRKALLEELARIRVETEAAISHATKAHGEALARAAKARAAFEMADLALSHAYRAVQDAKHGELQISKLEHQVLELIPTELDAFLQSVADRTLAVLAWRPQTWLENDVVDEPEPPTWRSMLRSVTKHFDQAPNRQRILDRLREISEGAIALKFAPAEEIPSALEKLQARLKAVPNTLDFERTTAAA
jgi:hypothetical protein